MNKNYKNILIILLISVVIMLPLFLNGNYYSGHDSNFHIANVVSLKEQITNNLNTYIMPNIVGSFGYGTRLFYPILSHLTIAIISILTSLNVLISFKIAHFLTLFLSGISMYFLSKKITKSNKTALISALIYVLFPYHLSDIYIRDALGECFLFIFIPIILLGLSYLFENKNKFYLFFTLGYIGGMLSHFTMMIYFTLLLIPFFIINRKRVFKKDVIITLILTAITILLIVSPSLVTMIEHKLFGDYAVYANGHMAQGIWWAALSPFKYIDFFASFNANEVRYYLDPMTIVLMYFTIKNRKKLLNQKHKFLIIFGLSAVYFSSLLFPWDIMPQFFRMIQFPWRLEIFVAVIVSLIAPLCIEKLEQEKYNLLILILLLCGTLSIHYASNNVVDLDNIDYSYGTGWQQEYLPMNALEKFDYLKERSCDIISTTGTSTILLDKTPYLSFKFVGESTIELPRIYYLGYTLKDEDGNIIKLKESELGLIEADVKTGTYYLDYTGTKAFNLATKFSLIATIIYILVCLKGLIWKK